MRLPKKLFVRTNKVVEIAYVSRTTLEELMKDETAEITIGEYQLVRVFKAKNETTIATREPTKGSYIL